MRRSSVMLYCNGGCDDRQAVALLSSKKIPHVNLGAANNAATPYLRYGPWLFSGICAIREFVERYEKRQLPSLDILMVQRRKRRSQSPIK